MCSRNAEIIREIIPIKKIDSKNVVNADLKGVGHSDSSGSVGDSTITKYLVLVKEICLDVSRDVIADSSFFLANSWIKISFSYSFIDLLKRLLFVVFPAIRVLNSCYLYLYQ